MSAEIPVSLRRPFERMHGSSRAESPSTCLERREILGQLEDAVRQRIAFIVDAIREDFGHRSTHETLLSEVHLTLSHIRYVRKKLRRWMRPRRCPVSWTFFPGRARILHQPLGVVGIVSPWNYPVYLSLIPCIEALAAGNRVMLKPSELSPRTSELLRELVESTFSPELAVVVTGGKDTGSAFCRLPFDHLFFTGSTSVGRSVLSAASSNLTPVTLELGGKSPAILGPGYPVEAFARRVSAGKLLNAGQTCLAPDYVLTPADRLESLVERLRVVAERYYPTLSSNPDYTSIISERHFSRLQGLLRDAREKGGRIIEVNPLQETDLEKSRKIAPTIITDVRDEMLVMQDEIFGPILPVRPYETIEDVVRYVNTRPRPLALYYFDRDPTRVRYVLESTCSGGACINDTVLHAAQDALPFGGVGASGMGAYRGRRGFETFSHSRSVFYQCRFSPAHLLRPPYKGVADRILRWLVGWRGRSR